MLAQTPPDLGALLLDYQEQQRYASTLERSILALRATAETGLMDVEVGQTCVAVATERGPKIIGHGSLVAAKTIEVRSPSGRWVRASGTNQHGEGALAEVVVRDPWFWLEVAPFELAGDVEPRVTTPVFTAAGIGTPHPALAGGVVLRMEEGPLSGVLVTDVMAWHGAPLLLSDGRLVGVTYRRDPTEERRTWAIGAGRIGGWFRTKSKAAPE